MLNANIKKTYIGENFLNPSKKDQKVALKEVLCIQFKPHICIQSTDNVEPERNGTHPSCQCYNTTTIQDFLKI